MDTKPGKYDNITLKQYHEMPGWSKSTLDKINRSPAHYLEWKQNPPEQTAAMAFGSALHCAVLTPDLYQTEYAVMPECDRRTKDGKATYAQFCIDNPGKSLVSSEQAGNIERMRAAIFDHPLASQIFSNGEAEQSFFWNDPKTGLLCKARPDYLRNDGIVVDLKTCENARFKEFQKSVYNYRYHVQGSFYMDGIFQATKKDCSDFVLVAIEKESPYGIMVFRLDDLAITTGRVSYEKDLATIKEWQEHPEAYKTVYQLSQSPVEMSLPAWPD